MHSKFKFLLLFIIIGCKQSDDYIFSDPSNCSWLSFLNLALYEFDCLELKSEESGLVGL